MCDSRSNKKSGKDNQCYVFKYIFVLCVSLSILLGLEGVAWVSMEGVLVGLNRVIVCGVGC